MIKPDMDYDELAATIYEQNKAVGWWDDPNRCLYECLQLVSTEVAEATEAERKNLMDDHLPDRKGGEVELADAMIRVLDLGGRLGLKYETHAAPSPLFEGGSVGALHLTINSDLIALANSLRPSVIQARTAPRYWSALLDTIAAVATALGYDLAGAMAEKLEYNKQRADHKRDARAQANGKRF